MKKEYPIGENKGRKSIYCLNDNMFKFWYKFIPSNIMNIESEMGKVLIDRKIRPQMSEYMGKMFEGICIQYIIRRNRMLSFPIMFDEIGRWWGNNSETKRQGEIDVLAVSDKQAIFGDCKWRNEMLGMCTLNALIDKSKNFTKYKDKFYILFSKSGFTEEVYLTSKEMSNLELVDIPKLFEVT